MIFNLISIELKGKRKKKDLTLKLKMLRKQKCAVKWHKID